MNWLLDEWAQRMLSATLQGALVLSVALLVALLPRLPNGFKLWGLRIALIKMHLSAIFVGGFALTVAATTASTGAQTANAFTTTAGIALWIAFAMWVLSVTFGIVRYFRNKRLIRALVHDAHLVKDPYVREIYGRMCLRMNIENPPSLKSYPGIGSPLLAQNGTATILLPTEMLDEDASRIETALAHELAHHLHRDLKWGWLLAISDLLFFFNPLVNPAIKRLRLCEECAADSLAMVATNSTPSAYSQTLLSFAQTSLRFKGAYAMAEGALELDKRIKALYNAKSRPLKTHLLAGVLVVAIGFVTLLPWTLQAAAPQAFIPRDPVTPVVAVPASGSSVPVAAPVGGG